MADHPYPTERTWTDCEAELEWLRIDAAHWKFMFDSCAKDRANLIDEAHELRRVLQAVRSAIKGVQENG